MYTSILRPYIEIRGEDATVLICWFKGKESQTNAIPQGEFAVDGFMGDIQHETID